MKYSHTFIAACLYLLAVSGVQAASPIDSLKAYVNGGDQQNVSALNKVLHEDFISIFTFRGDETVKELDREKLLAGFKKKKFGGSPRDIQVQTSLDAENLSIINAKLTGEKLTFSGTFVMVKNNRDWQLRKEILVVELTQK